MPERGTAKRVTLRDIARTVGVSPSAVSLVARGDSGVSEQTRRKVLAAMRAAGYEPRQRELGADTRGVLALIVEKLPLPVLADIAYAEVVGGMQAEAREQGYFLALHEIASPAELDRVVNDARDHHLAGLLILGGGDLKDADVLRLAATGRPTVIIDNYVLGQRLDCVLPDHRTAGFLATQHLIDLGHQRIGFLAGPTKYKTLLNRLEGYFSAMTTANVPIEPDLIIPAVSGTPRKGYLQMKDLLRRPNRPTAVVAVSDKTAFGALEAARESGVQIPSDLALVGIDDVPESSHTDPPLTTVSWSKREVGMLAVRQFVHRQRQPEAPCTLTLTYCDLVVRGSTTSPPL